MIFHTSVRLNTMPDLGDWPFTVFNFAQLNHSPTHTQPATHLPISLCTRHNMLSDLVHLVMVKKRFIEQDSGTVHLDSLCTCEDKRGECGEREGGVFVPQLHADTHRKTEHGQVLRCEGEVLVVNVRVSGENGCKEDGGEEVGEDEEGGVKH